jgi:hypothetical protein
MNYCGKAAGIILVVVCSMGSIGFAQMSNAETLPQAAELKAEVNVTVDKADASTPSHTVTLTWKPSLTPGVQYNVYRRDVKGNIIKVNPSPLPTTKCVDSTVTIGQTYFYTAKAVNSRSKESRPSNEVTVVVPSH